MFKKSEKYCSKTGYRIRFLVMKLHMSYSIICVFALLINKVSLQAVNVAVGVTGGSVVLPCATSDIKDKLSDITVQWRHNDSLNVCAIIDGTFSLQYQDITYKNRTETFPTEYKKGNFSIKLNNLACTDAGNYQCYIIHSYEEVIIQLIIKDTGEQQTPENGNQARETSLIIILVPVFSVFILLCLVLCITFIWKKWCKKTPPPPEESLPSRDVSHDDLELRANGNELNNQISLLPSKICRQD